MTLKTKRLILRPIRMSEAPLYFAYSSLPEVSFGIALVAARR
jgi:RimJ/RimL family protein N-acetyltransferase